MSRNPRFGAAWFLFALSLVLHVVDEANHNFLAYYNPNARMIRERFHIPIPLFTFQTWILSLGIGITLLLLLTPSAFRGARWLRWIAVPLAIVVGIFNAFGHIGSSFYYHQFMPGVYSSPILLASATFLLISVRSKPAAEAAAA